MGRVIDFPLNERWDELEEPPVDCPYCGGRKVEEIREPLVYGPIVAVRPCRACQGTGKA